MIWVMLFLLLIYMEKKIRPTELEDKKAMTKSLYDNRTEMRKKD